MPSFENCEKARQANFRKSSDTISCRGQKTPTDISRPYLLPLGCEEDNLYPSIRGPNGAHQYFEDREIHWWSHAASGDPGGLPTRNMASSQIACVNFLLPLIGIDGALTAVLHAIDDDVKDVVLINHRGITNPRRTTSPVELEWIGVDGPLEKDAPATRGAMNTSVDAFMVAETATGRRVYLLEWKYTESYRRGQNLGKGRLATRLSRYCELYDCKSSSFKGGGEIPIAELFYEPFYQLMRLRLLADRMVDKGEGELKVAEAKVVVVVPEGNTAYRERITSPGLCKRFHEQKKVSDVFRATLKLPEDAYGIVCPSGLVAAVERECGDSASEWVKYQRERYGL